MKEFKITKKDASQRIDKYIKKVLSDAPLSFIYRLFRVKDIKVNGKRVPISYILNEGDIISIYISDKLLEELSTKKEIVPVKSNIDIVYEDENILIVNKPRGILVHGDINEKRMTLTNQVLNYLYSKNEYDPKNEVGFVPSPAHRLDRNTSGLVLFGKNMLSLQTLFDMFKDKENVSKYYLALLNGHIKEKGEINVPLLKDEKTGIVKVSSLQNGGKSALTKYELVEKYIDKSLVKAKLITGRTHQLRVHFSFINHPIVGDSKYGDFKLNKQIEKEFSFKDQFLHAFRIEFHNIEGELSYLSNKSFEAPLPKKEKEILEILRKEKKCI